MFFWLTGLKTLLSAYFDKNIPSCAKLTDLLQHTETIVGICKKDESVITSYFSKSFENNADEKQMFHNLENLAQKRKTMDLVIIFDDDDDDDPNNHTATLHAVQVQLWISVVEMFVKNKDIAERIEHEKEIREIVDEIKKNDVLNEDACINFGVKSIIDIAGLEEDVFYLFDIIKKSNSSKNEQEV